MKNNITWQKKLLYFVYGALSLGVVGVLLGAASDYQKNTLNYGRYQISSWATQVNGNSGMIGAFVMDTVSGETRTVYIRAYGDLPNSKVIKSDLKKPFSAIR